MIHEPTRITEPHKKKTTYVGLLPGRCKSKHASHACLGREW